MKDFFLESISPAPFFEDNKLYLDFITSAQQGISPWLNGFRSSLPRWKQLAEASASFFKSADESSKEKLITSLCRDNRRLDVDDSVLSKMERMADGGVQFILTGQQPGMLGGPLLTAYKVMTAIILAEWLEQESGVPVVPLYWCGGDDTDFHEIRHQWFLSVELSPVKLSLPAAAQESARPVGDIPNVFTIKAWESLVPLIELLPGFAWVKGIVNGALERARDHGEIAAAILISLFQGKIGYVDGRSGYVRRFSQSVFRTFMAMEPEVKASVRNQGRRLTEAGYHAQLEPGEDSGIFIVEKGRRRKVTPSQRSLLEEAIEHDIERCSPGVILRNLLQDYAFRPAAVVLGPAEIAYRAQMTEIYSHFHIEPPVTFPRLTATYLPPPLAEVVRSRDLDLGYALETPGRLRDALLPPMENSVTMMEGETLLETINSLISGYQEKIAASVGDRDQAKIASKLDDVKKRLERVLDTAVEAESKKATSAWHWFSELEAILSPGGHMQERSLSLLTPFLFSGGEATGCLMQMANTSVNDLLDGRPHHLVYST